MRRKQAFLDRYEAVGIRPKARVSVRILGSTFSPVKANATADKNGIADINITIPEFTKGRGAILVRAEVDKEVAELRRIIQPAKLKK